MLKLLSVLILCLMFIALLPYIVTALIVAVAILLKYAWIPVVFAGLLWLLSVIDKK